MAVKGRQAKLKDSHDRMRVVDVSWDLYSQVLWAHLIEYDQKDVNEGTYDITSVARIWCEGHETRRPLRSAEGAETENTGGLMGGQSGHGP